MWPKPIRLVPEKLFQLGMIAILFHDTGYLKRKEDMEGTGAKYTVVHVRRSAELTAAFLKQKHYSATDIKAVQNMILCTGLNAPLSTIPFQSELEKTIGFALATADLLGQDGRGRLRGQTTHPCTPSLPRLLRMKRTKRTSWACFAARRI